MSKGPVRYVDYGERCVRFVFGTDTAVERAVLNGLGSGILDAFAVVSELLSSHVLVVIGPVEFLECAMF